jgi:ornithine decarboxylase
MNTVKLSPHGTDAEYRQLLETHGSPLLVIDLHQGRQQYRSLGMALPGVGLYYAIKALDHPAVLRCLDTLGAGFDIASNGEIDSLQRLSVAPRNTIHTHPIKRDLDITTALRFGCTTFVIDNPDELLKFLPYKHRVGLMLRLSFRNANAICDLSKKYGCEPGDAPVLFEMASSLGLHIKGLSFHAGSQCSDSREHVRAVETCNTLIRQYRHKGAAPMSVLDIGGGFPVSYQPGTMDIDSFCAPVRRALAQLPAHVAVIAEPGRYIAAPAMKCLTSIIGKSLRDGRWWYYLDDGVYGSFSGQIYDHARYPLEVFSNQEKRYASLLAGPTCDSIDVVAEDLLLPELNIGDIIVGHMMGAYTAVSATRFNAIEKTPMVVLEPISNMSFAPNSTLGTYIQP